MAARHFDGERFFNPGRPGPRGFLDFLRWRLNHRREPSPRFLDDVVPSTPPPRVEGRQLRVTLVNHSTVLLQQAGANILTDPIWSHRTGPFAPLGVRRHRAPGVRWDGLPSIDFVLLSHNHYDHLDLPTLRRLAGRTPPQFIVPARVGALLRSESIGPVHELDWDDTLTVNGIAVHSVPAMHFSGRTLFDRNRTLWCGYVIETAGGAIYFAGDTAFGDHFAAIRERFGPPRLAFLPIGAYEPRWFMSPVHMSPEDAIRAHETLAAQTSIAIHHGTFQLGDEALDAPKQQLRASTPPESFLVLDNGESLTLD